MYSNAGIGRLRSRGPGHQGNRRLLRRPRPRELYLTGTDLDSGERVVFGDKEGDWSGIPVSKAVECSTALPLVYEPVEVNGRTLVDGGIYSTTNVDVAVERGAEFIVVVNPLVPVRRTTATSASRPFPAARSAGSPTWALPAIANQAFRLLLHQRLRDRGRILEGTLPRR